MTESESESESGSIPVLDHGYVKFIESWGKGEAGVAEAGIVEAARQSTQGSFRGWDQDSRLLAFLYGSKPPHASPFEFAGMVIEVQAPIFVFREWHRHRTQSYNELSARYTPLPDLNYVPYWMDVVRRSTTAAEAKNRQQRSAVEAVVSGEHAKIWLNDLETVYGLCQKLYENGLKLGVPKELARLPVNVGRYSRMRASANLRNWLAFLTLRMDPGAQWEIQQYAAAVGRIIASKFPQTWRLFKPEAEEEATNTLTQGLARPS